jgi:hypothetical protein
MVSCRFSHCGHKHTFDSWVSPCRGLHPADATAVVRGTAAGRSAAYRGAEMGMDGGDDGLISGNSWANPIGPIGFSLFLARISE